MRQGHPSKVSNVGEGRFKTIKIEDQPAAHEKLRCPEFHLGIIAVAIEIVATVLPQKVLGAQTDELHSLPWSPLCSSFVGPCIPSDCSERLRIFYGVVWSPAGNMGSDWVMLFSFSRVSNDVIHQTGSSPQVVSNLLRARSPQRHAKRRHEPAACRKAVTGRGAGFLTRLQRLRNHLLRYIRSSEVLARIKASCLL